MRRRSVLTLGAAMLGWMAAEAVAQVPKAVLDAEAARVASVQKVESSVVAVFGSSAAAGGGSGVLISKDGYALSNYHVTRSAGAAMKCGLSNGEMYDAVIVGLDMTGDVALLKLLGRDDFPAAELGDSDKVRVGDWAFAMGNPFLLATDFKPTVTYGVVSGVQRYQYPDKTLLEYADCIQTDASINPGNSGGPLFDASGKLIGINGRGSFEKRGRVNVGVGYAISINQIKNFLGALRGGLMVDHATLGATVSTDFEGRVRVGNILESSDAFRRGLKYEDEIISFAGRRIETVNGLKNALGVYPKDWRLPIEFRRGQERLTAVVKLEGAHRTGELAKLDGQQEEQPKIVPKDDDSDEKEGEGEEKPKDWKPKEGEKDKEKKPARRPTPKIKGAPHAAKEMPEAVKKVYEARNGFANYYFNRQEQERVWKSITSRMGGSTRPKSWTLTGADDQKRPVRFLLDPRTVRFEYAGGKTELQVSDDLTKDLAPLGSGGLPTALHLWRKLLSEGPTSFANVQYSGCFPVQGAAGLLDCFSAEQGKAEARFFVDPADGRIVLLEMYPDPEADPCQIYFSDYADFDGAQLPRRWEIRHADALFAVLTIDGYQFARE